MGTVGGRRTVTPVSEGAGALDGAAENTNKMLASYVCLQTGSIINPYYLNNLYCTGVVFFYHNVHTIYTKKLTIL